MAKRKRRTSSPSTVSAPRDANAIANRDLNLFPSMFRLRPLSTHPRSGRSLLEIEDRRTWSPGVTRPSRTPRQVARLLMALPRSTRSKSMSKEIYSFKLPKQTAVCVRREIRRQVINAKGVAGRKVRRPKRNAMSRISCRRK